MRVGRLALWLALSGAATLCSCAAFGVLLFFFASDSGKAPLDWMFTSLIVYVTGRIGSSFAQVCRPPPGRVIFWHTIQPIPTL